MSGERGQAFIGVDVGTASARAGIFDAAGRLLATARHPIQVWYEPGDIVEQSSEDIWRACATAIRAAMAEAKLAPEAIGGIGFDATCSLVVLGENARPLTVSRSGASAAGVIFISQHELSCVRAGKIALPVETSAINNHRIIATCSFQLYVQLVQL